MIGSLITRAVQKILMSSYDGPSAESIAKDMHLKGDSSDFELTPENDIDEDSFSFARTMRDYEKYINFKKNH